MAKRAAKPKEQKPIEQTLSMCGCSKQAITGRSFVGALFCSIRLKVQLDTVRI